MARQVARLGDRTQGVCSVHGPQGGTITTASTNSFVNDRGIARLGDAVTADCGHVSAIITASENSKVNERGIARLADAVGGGPYTATIITASTDNLIN